MSWGRGEKGKSRADEIKELQASARARGLCLKSEVTGEFIFFPSGFSKFHTHIHPEKHPRDGSVRQAPHSWPVDGAFRPPQEGAEPGDEVTRVLQEGARS